VRRTHRSLLRWTTQEETELPLVRAYLLGLTGVVTGDIGALAKNVAELERASDSPLAHDLELTLHAEFARRQGHAADALRLLEAARMQASWDQSFNSTCYSRAYLRWLRAELLREQGRDRAALRI
jgi:hypothetical protein